VQHPEPDGQSASAQPAGEAVGVADVPLSVLAQRYVAVKAEVAGEYRARQLASRFGGHSQPGDADVQGKRDARAEAARRLGAGVSYGTLEKVAWLWQVAHGSDRRFDVKLAAFEALEEVDATGAADTPYLRAHALAMIEDVENLAGDEDGDPVIRVVADARLRTLRKLQADRVPPEALDKEARSAVALLTRELGAVGRAPSRSRPEER